MILNPYIYASPAASVLDNAVAYYKMDETTGDMVDQVNAHDGTVYGGMTRGGAGLLGNCYEGNGSNAYAIIPSSINDDWNNYDYTVSFWVNFPSASGLRTLLYDYDGVNPGKRSLICYLSGNTVIFRPITPSQSTIIQSSAISTNTWNHIILKCEEGGDFELIINNTSVGSASMGAMATYGNPIYVMARQIPDLYYDGEMDELAFFNGQLTSAQITELYNSGSGITI